MKQELKSGIPEFDNAVEQFENGEINFLELICHLWNTAYAVGKSEQLNLPRVSNLLCGSFEPDNKTSSATRCKCGREKWEHPKAT